jgi:hypothetical protein
LFGELGEIVWPPTLTHGERDGDRVRVAAGREVTRVADERPKQVINVEFVEEEDQEYSRRHKRRRTFGEQPKEAGAERAAPAFDVSTVLLPSRLETPAIRLE